MNAHRIPRLIAAVTAALVTITLFQSVASLGDPTLANEMAQAPVTTAAVYAANVR
jgi:hypothetical protein